MCTAKFCNLLESFGLTQHVQDSTHSSRHTLDLVITKSHETPISGLSIIEPLISDLHCIFFNLHTIKPTFPHNEITYRKMNNINYDSFQSDLAAAIANFDSMKGFVPEIALTF